DLQPDDFLIIAGGDGTLNRFVNDTAHLKIHQRILYFPVGSGNDFARDMGAAAYAMPMDVTNALSNLPQVTVKGETHRFINGVGYGIDGYCCKRGDELRTQEQKKTNYTSIAIGGLLGKYHPTNALVEVDGKRFTYKNVWIAPTMQGRYYGGGMMPTPDQNRFGKDGRLSLMMFHHTGPLRTLCIFPNLFKGTHIKHKKCVCIHTGRDITVTFDRPTPLQIDGETIDDVTSYHAFIQADTMG
ncbi:MAG: diacylglycerol kinase family protein, partial [Clostridia bacterium]|nr:diacylglycerol kinase family protein [Clostridia bacterium]